MPFRRGNIWWCWVRLREGGRVRRSLGTPDRGTAVEIERMVRFLEARRDWELLELVQPAVAYDHWIRDDLDTLRARTSDVDLREYVASWQAWLNVAPATKKKYLSQLRVLVPTDQPLLRSALTRSFLSERLHELKAGRSGSTVRRYHAAWSSFFEHLVEREVLSRNPIRGLRLPRENAPRDRWLELSLSARLVEAHPYPFRGLAALREGAGVEIGAALWLRRRDIDAARRIVRVRGTKTPSRNRFALVDEWAWGYLETHMRAFLPNALLWEGITYDAALRQHRKACAVLGIEAYRIHDARHSYAVRHMKAGDDPVLIANNLGHKDATMVLRVYGKYRPKPEDYDRFLRTQGGNQ